MTDPIIAVDAMGGDHAPASAVDGCVQAAREYNLSLLLVGRRPDIETELTHHDTRGLSLEIVHASETVGMGESPTTALRRKKDSSIRVGAELVRNGKAQALVSAGNTGAVMTTAKVILGTLEGVARPALTAIVPNLRGLSVWLDVGANVDCRPDHLVQFALMGHLYAREILGVSRPRIGLLSIGEEDSKGNEQTREALKVLKSMDIRDCLRRFHREHIAQSDRERRGSRGGVSERGDFEIRSSSPRFPALPRGVPEFQAARGLC
jgi:glycerol-3-phosphate acyltransferase PlsX